MAPADAARQDGGLIARLPLAQANPAPVQPAYRRSARFIGWLMRRITRQNWDDAPGLPRSGGVVVVANHISNADPLVLAHYLVWQGRWPRFLAKIEVWSMPVAVSIRCRLVALPLLARPFQSIVPSQPNC